MLHMVEPGLTNAILLVDLLAYLPGTNTTIVVSSPIAYYITDHVDYIQMSIIIPVLNINVNIYLNHVSLLWIYD